MKTVVTVTGIRPDFIRMSRIFKKLDENFNHVLIHTGQHYDKMLSDVFFNELEIRKPDYNLKIGGIGKEHFHQTAEVSIKIIELIRNENIKSDIIIFLGDSNSVECAVALKKEGYTIGHIEAGMRSHDKRMLEEINRTVCDHCADYHFVYHDDYKQNLVDENLEADNIFVVGNTIREICDEMSNTFSAGTGSHIILDIHRPENFKYKNRLGNVLKFANKCKEDLGIPVYMLKFKRTLACMQDYKMNIGNIELIDLMSYKKFIEFQNDSLFIISDSGTAQEEPGLLGVPVIVPRDYTERPQSVNGGCSKMLDVNIQTDEWDEIIRWARSNNPMDVSWLGDGNTSDKIIDILKEVL